MNCRRLGSRDLKGKFIFRNLFEQPEISEPEAASLLCAMQNASSVWEDRLAHLLRAHQVRLLPHKCPTPSHSEGRGGALAVGWASQELLLRFWGFVVGDFFKRSFLDIFLTNIIVLVICIISRHK